MKSPDIDSSPGAVLSRALRGVRGLRGLSPTEIAKRMGVCKRTYEYLDAGTGRIRLDRILAFADATDSDALAILTSVITSADEIAVRCADSKLFYVFKSALVKLNAELGEDLALLTARDCFRAFDAAMESLAAAARNRRAAAETFRQESAEPDVPPTRPNPA
ncbi:helix-turn-helix domain-containing protein [Phenylobacterium sp.]|uniref:helix-turn-helix domain-containing protein n=1 Tax=Phenylobacterium sp. TaxID=1871053 RepID=UPI003BAA7859